MRSVSVLLFICPNYKFYYCKKCFTDEQYEHVEQIIERNRMSELSDSTSVAEEDY